MELSGLLIVGEFERCGPAVRQDGSEVYPGLHEVRVRVTGSRGGGFTMQASAFAEDEFGRTHPALEALRDHPPAAGEKIAVQVKARATVKNDGRTFVNYDLVNVERLGEAPAAGAPARLRAARSAS